MEILVCVKRVPATGGRITLTADRRDIDTSFLGFTVSPHEECAVEEAVRVVEAHGGSVTVLTLGPQEAEEQLRDALALGADDAVLLEAGGREWDPIATAEAIVGTIRARADAGRAYDLLLFGNEAADSGDHQVPVRVAHALGLPCVTGVKSLEIGGGTAVAKREADGGWDVFEVPLPAVLSVKEGMNLPRFPSVPGRLRARKRTIERVAPTWRAGGLEKIRLEVPEGQVRGVEVLGDGPDAAPKVVEVLEGMGLV